MFAADLGKTAGKRWDIMQVLCKKWKNTMNSPFLTHKEPHFLPPSREIEGVRDQSWQGQKWPCSSSRIARIRPCRKSESTISWEGELSGFSFPCRSQHIVMSARLWGERRLSGIKKGAIFAELWRIPVPAGLSPWSICTFFNVRELWFLYTQNIATPQNIIINGIDQYVGYCIQHIDQYYANKFVMSVFAISVKV